MFRLSFKRLLLAAWLLLSGSSAASASELPACNGDPVYAFSQALYLQQYARATELLRVVRERRGVTVAEFLRQVMAYKRAYESDDRGGVRSALKQLDSMIATFSDPRAGSDSGLVSLDQVSIRVHAARMHLAAGNVLRAVRLARSLAPLLVPAGGIVTQAPEGLLAAGLYHYYAGRGDEDLGWLIGLFKFSGDSAYGLSLIQRALDESDSNAFEAARSLLADIAWNRQQTCPALKAFDALTSGESRDAGHYQQQVAAFLFCGAPAYALALIDRVEAGADDGTIPLSLQQAAWLEDARLFAQADEAQTGELERQLMAAGDQGDARRLARIRFALARAHDQAGDRERALALYRSLSPADLPDAYARPLEAYLLRPYQAPLTFAFRDATVLRPVCVDG